MDLVTGDLIWETVEADIPLLVVDDKLIAQAGTRRNRMRILVYDLTRAGECILETDPIVFPDWVVTGEVPGHAFSAHWSLDHSKLHLEWEARAWPTRKMSLGEARAAHVKRANGKVLIDLGSGQVRLTDLPPQPPQPPPHYLALFQGLALRWHSVIGNEIKAVVLAQAASEPDKDQVDKPPIPAGDTKKNTLAQMQAWMAAHEDPDARAAKSKAPQEQLLLYTWDASSFKLLSREELCIGRHLLVRATLDNRYIYVRQADPGPLEIGGRGVPTDPWTIYEVTSGHVRGKLPHDPGMSSLVILGRRAYYTVPEPIRGHLQQATRQKRALKAIDLETGKLLWERSIAGKLLAAPTL